MSKFIPNREDSRAELISCFHLKKSAAESYRLLGETYGVLAPLQDGYERWFRRFRGGDFEVADNERGKSPKNSKMWTRMISKHKNNSPRNWTLVNTCVQSSMRDGKYSEDR